MEISEAIELLSKCINSSGANPVFKGKSVRFEITDISTDAINELTKTLGLECTHHLNNESEIDIVSNKNITSVLLFYDENDFCNRADGFLKDFDNTHFIILTLAGESIEKYPAEEFSEKKALFFNYYYFNEIFAFLAKQDHFMSFYSSDERRFVLFTSEVGPFDIKYDLNDVAVKNLENLKPVYNRLLKEFEKVDFVQFFKSAIINTIHSYSIEDRFYKLVQSLTVILNIAVRDHVIYIRNFDFDKIKTKFKEERNKYFEGLEKNIDSIKSQVTSFPLTFSATIFTAYQVKEKSAILILVFMAYVLYTFIAWRILDITSSNKDKIKDDVDFEEGKIKTGFEILYDDFKKDFNAIRDKINKIEGLISTLKCVLIGLLISFFVFAGYQIGFASKAKPQPTEVRIIK